MTQHRGHADRVRQVSAKRLIANASLFAMAAACSGTAWAQAEEPAGADGPATAQTAAQASGGTGEIVVTAQFRAQKLQDTPIAITAVTGAMLEARAQTNLADVAGQAPSVVLKPATAAFGPSITVSIRGMGQIDFNPAYEPGVGIYIDDVYYPRLIGANLDLLDVERIEILRGPQGTLTGRNSEGGAIKFISRQPDGRGGGYISGTYGSRNRIALRASADFTLAKALYARFSGTFSGQDGYVDQIDYGCAHPGSGVAARQPAGKCTISKFGDVNYQAVKGIVRWNPSDTIDATISADYARDSRNSSAEVLLYGNNINPNVEAAPGVPLDSRFICGRFCNYATNGSAAGSWVAGAIPPLQGLPLAASSIGNRSLYTGWGLSGNAVIGITDDVKLTSITGYRRWDTSFNNDGDLSPANTLIGYNELHSKSWSEEVRLNAKVNSWADLTLGGYYSDEKTTYYTKQDIRFVAVGPAEGPAPFPLPLFPLQFIGDDPVHVRSKAVFGTLIVKATTAMTITGGARYTKDSKDYTFYRYNFDGTTINPFVDPVGAAYGSGYNGPGGQALSGTVGRFRGDRFDYRLSLDYRFSPQVLAYATTSTGFKGGGIGPRPFNAAQAQPFGPEKLTAYEIGLKTDLFDRSVRLNLAAYYNKFTDAQLTLQSCPQFGGPGPCALPQNAGNADVKGLEAELFVHPVGGLQIDASASRLWWNWKCVDPQVLGLAATGKCDSTLASQLTTPPQGVSKVQWSIGAEYKADLKDFGSLTPRVDIVHQGAVHGTATVQPAGSPSALYGEVAPYTLANARLTWRNADEDLDISIEVSNLFNTYYFLNRFDLTGAGAGVITGLPGRPREWAITAKKKF